MSTADHPSVGVAEGLTRAREQVAHVHRALKRGVVDAHTAHAAVAGVHHLAGALAGLVGALMDQLAVKGVDQGGEEVQAAREAVEDLRAMSGCLRTGVMLLEPALDDLHGLVADTATNATSTTEVGMWDEVADGDRADQAAVVEVDSTADNTAETVQPPLSTDPLAGTTEADPMDVADQHRIARVDDDSIDGG